MNFDALFTIVCIFIFGVSDAAHIGIAGYSKTGISSVLTRVLFNLGDEFLNLLKFVRTALPSFLMFTQCPAMPLECNFNL